MALRSSKQKKMPICPACASKKIILKDKFFACKKCQYQYAPAVKDDVYDDYYQNDIGLEVQNILEEKPHLRKYALFALRVVSKNQTKKRLLDIGCGTGAFLNEVKKYHYTPYGYDISKSQTTIAQKKNKLNNVRYSQSIKEYAKKMHISKKYFDVITCFEVIEHIPDVNAFLHEVCMYLKDDGIFICSTPNNDRIPLHEVWDYPPIHVSRFRKNNITLLLKNNGLLIDSYKTFNELGYYSGNFLAKLSFSQMLLKNMVHASKGTTKNAMGNKKTFHLLSMIKNVLSKILDIPIYTSLLLFPAKGHTMFVVIRKNL